MESIPAFCSAASPDASHAQQMAPATGPSVFGLPAEHTVQGLISRQDTLGRQRLLRLGWDGPKSLDHWLTEEWERRLYLREGRVWRPVRRAGNGQAVGLRLPPPPEPHLKMPPMQSHQAAASSVRFLDTPAAWQTVYATGTSTWHARARHRLSHDPVCLCGKPEPSMAHLLWARSVETGRHAPRRTRVKSGCWRSRFRWTLGRASHRRQTWLQLPRPHMPSSSTCRLQTGRFLLPRMVAPSMAQLRGLSHGHRPLLQDH